MPFQNLSPFNPQQTPIFHQQQGQQQQQNPYQPYRQQPLVNNAQEDPYLKQYLDTWKQRLGELKSDEGNLRNESDARTKQLISQSTGDISDRAAGAGAALSESLSRRGVAGSGVEAGARSGLSEASQRTQARAATDITNNQNARYEDQRLARSGQQNALLSSGLSAAGSIGQNMLQQQGLGLQQQQVQNQQSNHELDKWMDFYKNNQATQANQQPQYQGGGFRGQAKFG